MRGMYDRSVLNWWYSEKSVWERGSIRMCFRNKYQEGVFRVNNGVFEDSVFLCYIEGDFYLQNDLQASIWSNRI